MDKKILDKSPVNYYNDTKNFVIQSKLSGGFNVQSDIDLKQIQRKIYISYFQDGLWDILLGVFLIGWGLMVTYDFVAVIGGIWVAFYFIILGLKRWLTYPRAGYIKIPEARKKQIKMVILGAVVFLLGLAVFLLFTTNSRPEWLDEYFMLMLGAMFALIIVFLAGWWRVNRWYAYAVIVLLAFMSHQWLDTELNLSFFVPGGLITICGLVFLVSFLNKYPKQSGEGTYGGA